MNKPEIMNRYQVRLNEKKEIMEADKVEKSKNISKKDATFYFENSSLGDVKQMESTLIDDGVLKVTDNADFNHDFASSHGGYGDVDLSKSLSYNIQYGYGDKDSPWNEPREFITKAKEDIKDSNSHVETMKNSLKKRLGNDVVK